MEARGESKYYVRRFAFILLQNCVTIGSVAVFKINYILHWRPACCSASPLSSLVLNLSELRLQVHLEWRKEPHYYLL